jgi:ATP-dependent helicase/nuclease subunit A
MRNIEFIVAGAGSGKTYTLTGRLTDAIRGGLRPDEVMLTTFTEMAAAEFREKARERLLKEGLTEQAATLDTAAIGTVHSVAFTFVKRYWYKLGMGPDPEVMPEEDARAVMDSALFHIVTQQDVEAFEQLHRYYNFQGMGNGHTPAPDPEFWKKHLSEVIEKLQSYAITDLAESERHSLGVVSSLFNRGVTFNEQMAKDVLGTYCDSVQPTSAAATARRDKARDLSTKKEFGLQELVDLLGIDFGAREIAASPALDALLAHAGEALRGSGFGAPIKDHIQRIFRLAAAWQKFYAEYKLERGLMDYNDMESGFLRLLDMAKDDEELKQDIQSRCRLVLVDEFQDSSPVQVKIFMHLSMLAERSVWVGDIKQAIYGFRGTDSRLVSRVLQRFSENGGGHGLQMGTPLSDSYRSRPALVELSNSVFVRAFQYTMKAEHVKLDATRNDVMDFGAAVPEALHHWHLTDRNAEARAAALAQHLFGLLSARDVKVYDKHEDRERVLRAGDIAILCRGNDDCGKLAQAVRTLGLRAVISQEGADITETAEFRVLHAMLRFAMDTRSELPKAELLHLLEAMPVSEIVQSKLDFSEQDQGKDDEDGQKALWQDGHVFIERLTTNVQRLQGLPVPALVEGLVMATGLRDEVCRWGLGDLRGENIDVLIRQAMSYDERCERLGLGASLSGFISHISTLRPQKSKPVQHPDAIGIYTYHASKGLEWPVVILFDLNDDPLQENETIRKSFFGVRDVSVSAQGDALLPGRMVRLLPWFMGAKKTLPEDMVTTIRENPFYQQLIEDSEAEARRLLYVGVTRARDMLITTSHGSKNLVWAERALCPAVIPANCTDGAMLDVFGSGKDHLFQTLAADTNFQVPAAAQHSALKRPGPDGSVPPRFLTPSAAGAHRQVSATASLIGKWEGRIATTNNSELSDAQFGDCLHHILCAFRTGDDDDTALARVQRTLQNHMMAHVFPEPQRIVTSIRQLYALLQQHYGPATAVGHEVPMAHRLRNGQTVRGTIDMLWHTDQGTVIIDLKTYRGGEQDVLNPQGHHFAGMHAPQLLMYADALRASGQQVRATAIAYLVGGMLVDVKTVADT